MKIRVASQNAPTVLNPIQSGMRTRTQRLVIAIIAISERMTMSEFLRAVDISGSEISGIAMGNVWRSEQGPSSGDIRIYANYDEKDTRWVSNMSLKSINVVSLLDYRFSIMFC